jgi:hypothetical protein
MIKASLLSLTLPPMWRTTSSLQEEANRHLKAYACESETYRRSTLLCRPARGITTRFESGFGIAKKVAPSAELGA